MQFLYGKNRKRISLGERNQFFSFSLPLITYKIFEALNRRPLTVALDAQVQSRLWSKMISKSRDFYYVRQSMRSADGQKNFSMQSSSSSTVSFFCLFKTQSLIKNSKPYDATKYNIKSLEFAYLLRISFRLEET